MFLIDLLMDLFITLLITKVLPSLSLSRKKNGQLMAKVRGNVKMQTFSANDLAFQETFISCKTQKTLIFVSTLTV